MEVTEEIREEEGSENSDDLFFQLLNGKTVREKIPTTRGEFMVKFPKEKDIERIGILVAQRRMGVPAASFDVNTENSIYKCVVLDVIVEGGPAWFENAKKKNVNFSWRDMPDVDFIDEVYTLAYSFRQTVQAKFKRPDKAPAGEDGKPGVENDVGDGIFSGVASAPEGT
ncbi:hypothetical protein FACS1894137_07280 [Spirochaetia bacterium]|nr:hypothetical protein FACS1894137_07280 [Spirochaetia bacterium]